MLLRNATLQARRLGLSLGLLALLAGCGAPQSPSPTHATSGAPPATAVPATVAAQSTVAAQPTAVPASSAGAGDEVIGWPGAGWQRAASGDYNGDGLVEELFYRPSSLVVQDEPGSSSAAAQSFMAEELLIAQDGAHGPFELLRVDLHKAQVDGHAIATFTLDPAERQPAALLVKLYPGSARLLSALPLNADGTVYGQALGVGWSEAEHAYAATNA